MNYSNCFNLQSLRVLVTRPRPQGQALCEHIEACHGQAIYLPTIDIKPPLDSHAFQQGITHIDQQD